jgi:hypothetical protein
LHWLQRPKATDPRRKIPAAPNEAIAGEQLAPIDEWM